MKMIKKMMMMALAAVVLLVGPVAADHRGPHEGERQYAASIYACIDKEVALEAGYIWQNGTGTTELTAFLEERTREKTPEGYPVCASIGGIVTPIVVVGTFNRLSDNKILYIISMKYNGFTPTLYSFSFIPFKEKGQVVLVDSSIYSTIAGPA